MVWTQLSQCLSASVCDVGVNMKLDYQQHLSATIIFFKGFVYHIYIYIYISAKNWVFIIILYERFSWLNV